MTRYDPTKLLLSDHTVVKSFYAAQEQSKHKAYQLIMFSSKINLQQWPFYSVNNNNKIIIKHQRNTRN